MEGILGVTPLYLVKIIGIKRGFPTLLSALRMERRWLWITSLRAKVIVARTNGGLQLRVRCGAICLIALSVALYD